MKTRHLIVCAALLCAAPVKAQQDTVLHNTLEEVSISTKHQRETMSRLAGAENGMNIGQDELFKAACCNLGESFVTNPSVDVNYNDAAVGARQIKLLGLSGLYVQMLSENLPNLGGAASLYSLGYVPGTWMQSIAVSKGASSVKNGYQSITGQIDVEYQKPDDEPGIVANIYGNNLMKTEANVVANTRLNKHLSTIVMGHYEQDFAHHDVDNDGWHDFPAVKQYNVQNRWKYQNGRYIFHGGLSLLNEEREGGQLLSVGSNPYRVLIDAQRYEAYMKHAYVFNEAHGTNLALMTTVGAYDLDGQFGNDHYLNGDRSLYSQLMLEHNFNDIHSLSTGLTLTADKMKDQLLSPVETTETVGGLYAQYTYKPSYRLTAMAGLRADHSNRYGNFVTPRLHVKWIAADWLTLRLSTGKGYRSPHALAENHHLLASGRTLAIADSLKMEEAWNTGLSAAFYVPVGERTLRLNAEYYYTDFQHQTVVDYDSDPTQIRIGDLDGRSYSHTLQLDAAYPIVDGLDLTAAFRLNDVRTTYGGVLLEKPLTSRYKGLLTLSYTTPLELWQFDVTLQLNGGGRMPTPYTLADGSPSWDERFPAYPQLNMQVTRWFRHFSVYVGAENLTNYRQPNPIINASDPWSPEFEPTLIWGPVHGIVAYVGLRLNLGKL